MKQRTREYYKISIKLNALDRNLRQKFDSYQKISNEIDRNAENSTENRNLDRNAIRRQRSQQKSVLRHYQTYQTTAKLSKSVNVAFSFQTMAGVLEKILIGFTFIILVNSQENVRVPSTELVFNTRKYKISFVSRH